MRSFSSISRAWRRIVTLKLHAGDKIAATHVYRHIDNPKIARQLNRFVTAGIAGRFCCRHDDNAAEVLPCWQYSRTDNM